MKTKRHKKYYIPGIISAILIPLVFWFYGNMKLKDSVPTVISLGLPAKMDSTKKWTDHMSFEPFRKWKYQKIIVLPNRARENSKFYVEEIKKLQERNEKATGIEFVLNDNNSYGDFVSVLNDLAIAKHDYYGLDLEKTGHLFAIVDYRNPMDDQEIFGCGYEITNYKLHENDAGKGLIKFYDQLLHLPKQTYYIVFGYLILLHISVLSLMRRPF